jgi:hypothetical protein
VRTLGEKGTDFFFDLPRPSVLVCGRKAGIRGGRKDAGEGGPEQAAWATGGVEQAAPPGEGGDGAGEEKKGGLRLSDKQQGGFRKKAVANSNPGRREYNFSNLELFPK